MWRIERMTWRKRCTFTRFGRLNTFGPDVHITLGQVLLPDMTGNAWGVIWLVFCICGKVATTNASFAGIAEWIFCLEAAQAWVCVTKNEEAPSTTRQDASSVCHDLHLHQACVTDRHAWPTRLSLSQGVQNGRKRLAIVVECAYSATSHCSI